MFLKRPTSVFATTYRGDRPSSASQQIAVIVVATERLFGLGLARLLNEDSRLDVIGVSDGEPELLGLCKSSSVDVVLIDIKLSRTDAIDLVRLLAAECPNTKTLALTSVGDWRVRPALIAGAAGVLLKDTSPEAIRAAVVSVHLGDQVLCNEAARWVLGEEPSTRLAQRRIGCAARGSLKALSGFGDDRSRIGTRIRFGGRHRWDRGSRRALAEGSPALA